MASLQASWLWRPCRRSWRRAQRKTLHSQRHRSRAAAPAPRRPRQPPGATLPPQSSSPARACTPSPSRAASIKRVRSVAASLRSASTPSSGATSRALLCRARVRPTPVAATSGPPRHWAWPIGLRLNGGGAWAHPQQRPLRRVPRGIGICMPCHSGAAVCHATCLGFEVGPAARDAQWDAVVEKVGRRIERTCRCRPVRRRGSRFAAARWCRWPSSPGEPCREHTESTATHSRGPHGNTSCDRAGAGLRACGTSCRAAHGFGCGVFRRSNDLARAVALRACFVLAALPGCAPGPDPLGDSVETGAGRSGAAPGWGRGAQGGGCSPDGRCARCAGQRL